MIELLILLYIVSGVLAYGMTLGYCQKQYPHIAEMDYKSDMQMSRWAALVGPIGIIVISQYWKQSHGLMYRNPHNKKPLDHDD